MLSTIIFGGIYAIILELFARNKIFVVVNDFERIEFMAIVSRATYEIPLMLDSIINSFLLYLTMAENTEVYYRLCGAIDKCVQPCCFHAGGNNDVELRALNVPSTSETN